MDPLARLGAVGDYPFDLGTYSRAISTRSAEAQKWFDRGLNWTYGFNHEEAAACFTKATEADPDCAMAYWGLAYVAGPNYNRPWEAFDEAATVDMLAEARSRLEQARKAAADETERALIDALTRRYPELPPGEEFPLWNAAYADAMRAVYAAHPEDPDVATLFADALMNRTPWQMWDLRTGDPAEGADTVECREVLERGMRDRATPHPGLWHLYLHLMEMSGTPEVALNVGDQLRRLVPDSGHLAHMPTHIDVLCGNYRDVVEWNHIGIQQDLRYFEYAGAFNIYSLYRAHNYHFKLYGAMFLGQFEPAMEAVHGLWETIPEDVVRMEQPPMADWVEAYLSMRTHALVRFGRWQELIDDPLPGDRRLYAMTTAMNYYGRGVAHAALKQHDEAAEAQRLFDEAANAVPHTRFLHVVRCQKILGVARAMLAGELAYHRGEYEDAFFWLREAVTREDALPYDEPWGWMMPSRHALGALLLEQGHASEAAQVYEADLGLTDEVIRANRHPNNVWAMQGLYRCYRKLGRDAEARVLKPQLDNALARADQGIATSCFCACG
ncbi:hypothetical protein D5S17_06685 [Pseudonocardiaceae bacterium YIM PH 21723]|nr:hypothetical protein D5S17_06685 [Pseudonocardiaceae bacterium YIM PH 21723]